MNTSPLGGARPARPRLYYRKEKLRGACWEYEIDGGWIAVDHPTGCRRLLRHAFTFYRPREAHIRTPRGIETVQRTAAEQWFFPDRWFSLLRFTTADDRTVGYYVNFSLPLAELRQNYYRDLDLELDLWLDVDGSMTELDRNEFEEAIHEHRLTDDWARAVDTAMRSVAEAIRQSLRETGPDIEKSRDPIFGIPEFILRA